MLDIRIDTRTFLEILDGTNKDYVLLSVEKQPEFYNDPDSYSVEDYLINIIRKSDSWTIELQHEAYRGNIEDFCIGTIPGKTLFKHLGDIPEQVSVANRPLNLGSFKITGKGIVEDEENNYSEEDMQNIRWGDFEEEFTEIESDQYDHDSEKNAYWETIVFRRESDGKFFKIDYRSGPQGDSSDYSMWEVKEKTKTIKYYE